MEVESRLVSDVRSDAKNLDSSNGCTAGQVSRGELKARGGEETKTRASQHSLHVHHMFTFAKLQEFME